MANTNPITATNNADLFNTEVMAGEYLRLLAARGNPLTHPAILHATGPAGSNVVRVPHIGLGGYNLLSAATPGSEVDSTTLSDGKTDVTVARYSKRYFLDDLMASAMGGLVNPQEFALDAAMSVTQTIVDLLADVIDGFSGNTVSNTGVDLTWAQVVTAKTLLAVDDAEGAMLAILHPVQWGDLDTDALSVGGALQNQAGLQGAISAGMESYKGRILGIDFFTSSRVNTANSAADYAGAIITRGAVAIADTMYPEVGADVLAHMGRAILERDRQGTYGGTSYMTHAFLGAAKAIDNAGCTITSDA